MSSPRRLTMLTKQKTPELLDRASSLGRLLVTQDRDFLVIGTARQRDGIAFSGIVFTDQLSVPARRVINDLELIATAGNPEEFANRVTFLPLGGKSP
jgi:hypothetical protein